jgi:hypothetical protein
MAHELPFKQLQSARTLASAAVGGLLLAACMASLMSVMAAPVMASGAATATASAAGNATAVQSAIAFDIPAQPLQNALDAFGAASGFSGLYSVDATAGHNSTPVRGRYTPDAALHMLLENTGLIVRYTADDAFILELGTAPATAAVNTADAYYGALQSRVRDAFCGDSRLARGDYRVAMTFRIDAQGRVAQPALLSSTGNAARDRAVVETLAGIRLDRAPADPSQPFTMLILPGNLATACAHE